MAWLHNKNQNWSGVGQFITPSRLTTDRLRQSIQEVLTKPSYQENGLRLKTAIQKAGGVPRAVDIIEEVISNNLKSKN